MSQGETPRLAGQVALVTGAAQGIGRAIALRLARDGAIVGANDRIASRGLDEVAQHSGGHAFVADVSDRSAVEAMVNQCEREIGPVSVLVCNAAYMNMGAIGSYTAEEWWKVIDTNLTGTYHLIQAVLPGMRAMGSGRVIVMSSYWGVVGWADATAYSASKAGLIALTKTLGRELAPLGVHVNAIAPGVIATPQLEVDAAAAGVSFLDIQRRYANGVPLGRIGQPEEIAAAVAFLADLRIRSMVGQIIQVNGGEVRCRV